MRRSHSAASAHPEAVSNSLESQGQKATEAAAASIGKVATGPCHCVSPRESQTHAVPPKRPAATSDPSQLKQACVTQEECGKTASAGAGELVSAAWVSHTRNAPLSEPVSRRPVAGQTPRQDRRSARRSVNAPCARSRPSPSWPGRCQSLTPGSPADALEAKRRVRAGGRRLAFQSEQERACTACEASGT